MKKRRRRRRGRRKNKKPTTHTKIKKAAKHTSTAGRAAAADGWDVGALDSTRVGKLGERDQNVR